MARKILNEDETIQNHVKSQLDADTRVNATNIGISVENGTVTLTGTVPSFRGKDAASDLALMIAGVKGIENRLKVHYPLEPGPTDEEVKTRIENFLLWNPDLDSSRIRVNVKDGTATLKGEVETYWRKLLAEDDARSVLGAREVRNDLAVNPLAPASDEALEQDVREALSRDVLVNETDLEVEVENGTVTLRGTQPSWTARDEAVTVACCMPGVREINDLIAIA